MTQTLALLLDAYRELNARKMFWISLIISALVMVAFSLLGLGDNGLTFLWMKLPMPAPQYWYKALFSNVVIGLWISVGAMILALVSTASIFPDLLASGSIDLYLAKPMSRLRLFLTKYLGGLLFVLLQTSVFAVASYLVFGLRGGQWRPTLFLIIPLATLLFSYLFVVCVLFGVLTRSTVAAILLTCVFWLLCFAVNKAEQLLFTFRTMQTTEARAYEREAQEIETEIADLNKNPSILNAFGVREQSLRNRRDSLRKNAEESASSARKLTTAHRIVRGIATVVPKTGETIDLLDRKLFTENDLSDMRNEMFGKSQQFEPPPATTPSSTTAHAKNGKPTTSPTTGPTEADLLNADARRDMEQQFAVQRESQEAADRAARSRSIPWVLSTSIGFEVVALALAAWIFCRRDY
jgi:hypothetical protein